MTLKPQQTKAEKENCGELATSIMSGEGTLLLNCETTAGIPQKWNKSAINRSAYINKYEKRKITPWFVLCSSGDAGTKSTRQNLLPSWGWHPVTEVGTRTDRALASAFERNPARILMCGRMRRKGKPFPSEKIKGAQYFFPSKQKLWKNDKFLLHHKNVFWNTLYD